MAMILLGITGGVGMGKSACGELLRSRHIAVIDTDDLARRAVEPGQPALAEIQRTFGAEYLDSGGRLRRHELGRRVFADSNARQQLEAILHPRIRQLWLAEVNTWRERGQPVGAVIIPLLFETGAQSEFTATVCVACSASTQHQRLAARGWSAEQIAQRNRAQLPVPEKLGRANYVIWGEGNLELHAEQLRRVLASVSTRSC